MLNLEPWGKTPCVTTLFTQLPLSHPTTILNYSVVGWSIYSLTERPLRHVAILPTPSLTLHDVPFGSGWSVHYPDRELFVFSSLSEVKRNHDSLFECSVLLFLTDCWPANRFVLLILTNCYLAVGSSFLMGL